MKFILKALFVFVFTVFTIVTSAFYNHIPEPYRIRTIVIDAGHGGKDPGCKGANGHEKEITLGIALKVGKYIEENLKDVNVIYTRSKDKFIELHERAAIANRNNADLFISIHCNSGVNAAYGTETYTMGLHRTEANLKVAQFENSSILMEDDFTTQYDGFDPNSPESYIIFSLFQNVNMEKSLMLASKVENQFKTKARRRSRGVKQAGFLVLYRTAMPSVLIETGFITNKEEEKYLRSEDGQSYIASAIYRSFKEYKNEVEVSSN
ncbi:MAG: N-acetylmuramoyl-L-alanine amidase [Bacteroidia bacterium]|nr:N-acetylmuramoyl-L-alanine amidase [Bacteroidia bacterium]